MPLTAKLYYTIKKKKITPSAFLVTKTEGCADLEDGSSSLKDLDDYGFSSHVAFALYFAKMT